MLIYISMGYRSFFFRYPKNWKFQVQPQWIRKQRLCKNCEDSRMILILLHLKNMSINCHSSHTFILSTTLPGPTYAWKWNSWLNGSCALAKTDVITPICIKYILHQASKITKLYLFYVIDQVAEANETTVVGTIFIRKVVPLWKPSRPHTEGFKPHPLNTVTPKTQPKPLTPVNE